MTDTTERPSPFDNAFEGRRNSWKYLDSLWSRIAPLVDRVRAIFRDAWIRHRIFGALAPALDARDVRSTITAVAIANATMAGLPGKMGGGVLIAMAIEVGMAWRIATLVGVRIKEPRDVLKYFGLLGGTVATVLWGVRQLLNLTFAALSLLPAFLPATVIAELAVTDLVGVLFWVAFEEAREHNAFQIPVRSWARVKHEGLELLRHQTGLIGELCSREMLGRIGRRLRAFLNGESIAPPGKVSDDLFVAAAMAVLVTREPQALDGPLGREFLHSIRDLYPELRDASTEAITARMAEYDDGQMGGVLSNIKGRLFERMVAASENADGGAWFAELHADRTHPSTDMVITHVETGRSFEVSLKATDSPSYIEQTLRRYPDHRIWTTTEGARAHGDDPRVSDTGIEDEDIEEVTRKNFDRLLDRAPPTVTDAASHAAVGTALGSAASLWPFVAAYRRGRIDGAQFKRAVERQIGAGATAIASRVATALLLGPTIYPWFVLARASVGLTRVAESAARC